MSMKNIVLFWIGAFLSLLVLPVYGEEIRNENEAIQAAFKVAQVQASKPLIVVTAAARYFSEPVTPDWLILTLKQKKQFHSALQGKKYWVVHLKLTENAYPSNDSLAWETDPLIDARTGREIVWWIKNKRK